MEKIIKYLFETEKEEIIKLAEEHASLFKELSLIESLIIRGHILIERSINRSIEQVIPNKKEYKAERFSFSQKVVLGNMLGICDGFKTEINSLNTLRNQIAHTLEYDQNLLITITNAVKNKQPDVFNEKDDEIKRFTTCISFICGALNVAYKTSEAKLLISILQK